MSVGTQCRCQKQRHKEYDRYSRDKKSKQYYNGKEWESARKEALELDGGIDVYLFMTEGIIVLADTVHHIEPLRTQFTPSSYGGEYHFLDMWPMQSHCVTPVMDDIGIFGGAGKLYYQYNDPRTGKQYMFRNSEVLHFKTWYSFDGFMGEPVRNILKATVDGSNESQDYMNRLYKQGLTASMAMQYTGDLEDEKVRKLKRKFADMLSGPKNAGKVVPVPMGLTLTPLNMSLTDAQFFELRKYSALQIAGAFGIKPNQINNYEKSSYANSETQQLAFLVDTMSYRLKNYEEEINGKILLPQEIENQNFYKFNEKAILRTDSKTQMENLAKAVNNGIYTANEAREYMDMPAEEGGDQLMVNGNYIPITKIGQQYKGGEGNGNS
ncbi:phage portal protein [Blautia sp.]|uniref:phage portal protein n=1 Tax=Blautia sp. TaxID=1955243 RepID=UPI0025B84E4D|nr:phage portal protein [Blautia sp.]